MASCSVRSEGRAVTTFPVDKLSEEDGLLSTTVQHEQLTAPKLVKKATVISSWVNLRYFYFH